MRPAQWALVFISLFLLLGARHGRVVQVVDGDTVVLDDGQRVRYLGINTPERGEPLWRRAKEENARLVMGKVVRLEGEGGLMEDKYGRLLAYLFVDGRMVNEELLRRGLAHLFVIQPIGFYRRFYFLQEEARRKGLGIWGKGGFPGPLKITSLHADAPGDDRFNLNGEYVRICNISPRPISLRGFWIRDRRGHIYRFPAGELRPGYTLLLFSGKGRDMREGATELHFFWGSDYPIWNNKGDEAFLYSPEGKLIDRFRYRRRRP